MSGCEDNYGNGLLIAEWKMRGAPGYLERIAGRSVCPGRAGNVQKKFFTGIGKKRGRR